MKAHRSTEGAASSENDDEAPTEVATLPRDQQAASDASRADIFSSAGALLVLRCEPEGGAECEDEDEDPASGICAELVEIGMVEVAGPIGATTTGCKIAKCPEVTLSSESELV